MRQSQCRAGLLILAIVLGVAGGAGATAAATTIAWVDGATDASNRILRLQFEGAVPAFEVRSSETGPSIRLDELGAGVALPDDVRRVPQDRGVVLQVRSPGAALLAVRTHENVLELSISDAAGTRSGGYRLGVGDVVSVAVYEDKSLSGEYTVGQDGAINLPLVGAVPAVGASEAQLSERISGLLGDFLDAPSISVTIRSFQSQAVYVNITGEPPRAVKVPLRPGMTLPDVVSEAGVALLPGQRLELTSPGPTGERVTTSLTSSELDRSGGPVPRDGDVVTVLEPEYVFIRGEVRRPGRFTHRPGLTLQQLITLSGGLTEWAGRKELRIHRTGPDGEKSDLEINLKRIDDGRDPDVTLEPGDLVLVQRRVL